MSEPTNLKKPRFLAREIIVLAIVIIGYVLISVSKANYFSGLSPDEIKRLLPKFEGWNKGLDAITPEFETYWMNFLYIEFVLEVSAIGIITGFLWKSRDRRLAEISTREEVRRTLVHFIWLSTYLLAVYYYRVYFIDINAHNINFMPSQIIEVYLFYPVYITTGICAFLYAKTRLPFFMKIASIPYLMSLFVGPIILSNDPIKFGSILWFICTASQPWLFIYVIILSFVSIFRRVRKEGISS